MCIRDSFIRDYGIRKFKKAKKLHFKLKLEAGEPGGSNINRVSNKSRGSDSIVLIQAGGFYYRGNTVICFLGPIGCILDLI